ncbi:unnamed protein product [Didymodactylos carnosus]|uniref:Uncharacterized protein n=1 Tax=Didymodactylos carnosus TaxID=1234261 RepID=A0A8S2U9Q9_9BILA|nr:unnamed protein product [Didymodactylos carnosus]CAF4326004.1 unnamed protein product [Didymodactylos carnosus]
MLNLMHNPRKRSSPSSSYDAKSYTGRRLTNQAFEKLAQCFLDDGLDDINCFDTSKHNRNDTLSLTLATLIKEKYLNGTVYKKNIYLTDGVDCSAHDMNGFITVLTCTGRVVVISDDVKDYLKKSVRSLYSQIENIYDCVDENDKIQIQNMLCNVS